MQIPLLKQEGKRDTKQLIVGILGEEWPLTPQQIYRNMVKNYGNTVTYQAVHKSIVLLKQENTLQKDGTGYKLNSEWIGKLNAFSEALVRKYSGKHMDVSTLKEGESTTIEFSSPLAEVYYWALAQHAAIAARFGPLEKTSYQYRVWPITIINDFQYQQMKLVVSDGKSHMVHGPLKPVDEFLLRVWEGFGDVCVEGKENWALNSDHDTSVIGEFVFSYFHEGPARKEWWRVYDSIGKKVEMKPVYDFFFEKPFKSQIIVSRNQVLAQKYLNDTRTTIEKRGKTRNSS